MTSPNSCCTLRGFRKDISPNGVIYYHGGETVVGWNNNLSVYQQRPFLQSAVYNSGCAGLYGGIACGQPLCEPSRQMFDYLFTSTDPFATTCIPAQCVRTNRGYGCC